MISPINPASVSRLRELALRGEPACHARATSPRQTSYRLGMDVIDAIGNTPLIELKRVSAGLPNKVFIKCEHLNPGGSIKDRTARAIVIDAEERGLLKPGSTMIEGTAGNTGVGLALIAGARGYRLICVL